MLYNSEHQIGTLSSRRRFEAAVLGSGHPVESLEVEEPAFAPSFAEVGIAAATASPFAVAAWGLVRYFAILTDAAPEAAQALGVAVPGLVAAAVILWRTIHFDRVRLRFGSATFLEPEEDGPRETGTLVQISATATGASYKRLLITENQLLRFARTVEAMGDGWSLAFRDWTPRRNGFTKTEFSALRQVGEGEGWFAVTDGAGGMAFTEAGRATIRRWRDARVPADIIKLFERER